MSVQLAMMFLLSEVTFRGATLDRVGVQAPAEKPAAKEAYDAAMAAFQKGLADLSDEELVEFRERFGGLLKYGGAFRNMVVTASRDRGLGGW